MTFGQFYQWNAIEANRLLTRMFYKKTSGMVFTAKISSEAYKHVPFEVPDDERVSPFSLQA